MPTRRLAVLHCGSHGSLMNCDCGLGLGKQLSSVLLFDDHFTEHGLRLGEKFERLFVGVSPEAVGFWVGIFIGHNCVGIRVGVVIRRNGELVTLKQRLKILATAGDKILLGFKFVIQGFQCSFGPVLFGFELAGDGDFGDRIGERDGAVAGLVFDGDVNEVGVLAGGYGADFFEEVDGFIGDLQVEFFEGKSEGFGTENLLSG